MMPAVPTKVVLLLPVPRPKFKVPPSIRMERFNELPVPAIFVVPPLMTNPTLRSPEMPGPFMVKGPVIVNVPPPVFCT